MSGMSGMSGKALLSKAVAIFMPYLRSRGLGGGRIDLLSNQWVHRGVSTSGLSFRSKDYDDDKKRLADIAKKTHDVYDKVKGETGHVLEKTLSSLEKMVHDLAGDKLKANESHPIMDAIHRLQVLSRDLLKAPGKVGHSLAHLFDGKETMHIKPEVVDALPEGLQLEDQDKFIWNLRQLAGFGPDDVKISANHDTVRVEAKNKEVDFDRKADYFMLFRGADMTSLHAYYVEKDRSMVIVANKKDDNDPKKRRNKSVDDDDWRTPKDPFY